MFQNLLLVAFIAAVVFGAKPVYRKLQEQMANRACKEEVEAYAQKMRRAFDIGATTSSPPNKACRSITDVSAGLSIDSDIIAKARAPGAATFRCKINLATHCVET